MKRFFLIFLALLATLSLQAEYLNPELVGFRHLALIYTWKDADVDMFKAMLSKHVDGKPTAQEGFDGFLFLTYALPNGRRTENGMTDMGDWQWQLDDYFNKGINVPALDRAVAELRETVGIPVKNPQLVFSIPWMHPEVTSFGDVDGDGVSENLATSEGRAKVVNWYIDSVKKHMEKYSNVDLWGFYMMREGIGGNEFAVGQQVITNVHNRGYRMLWIPWYKAPGYDRWRELGFDAAYFQSNWTFSTSRRNRVFNNAEFAFESGAGFELELYDQNTTPFRYRQFVETLALGTKLGYQEGACAYYFANGFTLYKSADPLAREVYDKWMDFIAGKPIELETRGEWQGGVNADGKYELIYTLNEPGTPRVLDVFLEPERKASAPMFRGIAEVFYSSPDAPEEFKPLMWRYFGFDGQLLPYGVFSINLPPALAHSLKVVFTPDAGAPGIKVFDVDAEFDTMDPIKFAPSYQRLYSTDTPVLPAKYGDETGRQLIDGVTGGPWENYVGWRNAKTPVALTFDLGDEGYLTMLRLHILVNSHSGINQPGTIFALLSTTEPKRTLFGLGALGDNVLTFAHSPHYNTKSGALEWSLPANTRARYVTFFIYPNGWFFLSEAEFIYRGRNRQAYGYTTSRQPTSEAQRELYADDGMMLTDGVVSGDYNTGAFGFNGVQSRRIYVDLDAVQPVSKVTVHGIGGGYAGAYAPREVVVRLSPDGLSWTKPASVKPRPDPDNGTTAVVPVVVSMPQAKARYVEITVTPQKGWCFLSEITVE